MLTCQRLLYWTWCYLMLCAQGNVQHIYLRTSSISYQENPLLKSILKGLSTICHSERVSIDTSKCTHLPQSTPYDDDISLYHPSSTSIFTSLIHISIYIWTFRSLLDGNHSISEVFSLLPFIPITLWYTIHVNLSYTLMTNFNRQYKYTQTTIHHPH